MIVTHFLLPNLGALRDRHPEIELGLSGAMREANLLRGEAEIALRIGRVDVPPGLVVRSLGQVGYGLYGTREHVRRRAEDRVFVGFDESMAGLPQKQWLDAHAAGRRFVLRTNELSSLHRAAVLGWGIALLPHVAVSARDGLVHLPVPDVVFERSLSLVVHPDVRRAPRVRVVMAELVRLAETNAARLRGPLVRAK